MLRQVVCRLWKCNAYSGQGKEADGGGVEGGGVGTEQGGQREHYFAHGMSPCLIMHWKALSQCYDVMIITSLSYIEVITIDSLSRLVIVIVSFMWLKLVKFFFLSLSA